MLTLFLEDAPLFRYVTNNFTIQLNELGGLVLLFIDVEVILV